jgi:hypothetical protein
MMGVMQWSCLALVVSITACDSLTSEPPDDESVGSVQVSPAEVTMGVGQSRQLVASVFNTSDEVMTEATVTWSSSNSSIVAVDQTGRVSGASVGSATITAASGDKSGSAAVTVLTSAPPAQGEITLNAGDTHQRILGWEATGWAGQWACAGRFPTTVYDNYKNELFDRTVELGINRVRLEIRAGAERPTDRFPQFMAGSIDEQEWKKDWYDAINDNGSASSVNASGFQFSEMDLTIERVVLPLKQRLEARGERLYINLNFIDFGKQSSFNQLVAPEEYAEFVLATFQHIRSKYGWVPDAVEVILEPDNGAVIYSGRQVGEALVAAGNRLRSAGFSPDFIAPSGKGMQWSLTNFDQMMGVPGARQYVKELAYHRYGGVSASALRSIGERTVQYGIRSGMLEHIGSGYEDLHDDLEIGRNSVWQQYTIAGCDANDPGGRHFLIDAANPSNPRITLASRSHFLRQYFKYVRRGALRIGAASKIAALEPLAFINENGSYVVVVKAAGASSFTVGGLPAGRYGIVYTTGSSQSSPQQSGIEAPDIVLGSSQALSTNIPGRGVITIYGKS